MVQDKRQIWERAFSRTARRKQGMEEIKSWKKNGYSQEGLSFNILRAISRFIFFIHFSFKNFDFFFREPCNIRNQIKIHTPCKHTTKLFLFSLLFYLLLSLLSYLLSYLLFYLSLLIPVLLSLPYLLIRGQ